MQAYIDIHIKEKSFGARKVLSNLHLHIGLGESVSLIGASGCGKSTLLNIIAGLDRQFQGQVVVDGLKQTGTSRDIGFIFQEPRLFPWLSVAENIGFSLGKQGKDHPRVNILLKEVGLEEYANALPKHLSGGQAQRVAIARGILNQPRVLLLDEPFSAVDAFTRIKLQNLLMSLVQQYKLSVVMVTHDIDEALIISDRILMLDTQPGPLRAEFHVELPQPRDRRHIVTNPLKSTILDTLHEAHAF